MGCNKHKHKEKEVSKMQEEVKSKVTENQLEMLEPSDDDTYSFISGSVLSNVLNDVSDVATYINETLDDIEEGKYDDDDVPLIKEYIKKIGGLTNEYARNIYEVNGLSEVKKLENILEAI